MFKRKRNAFTLIELVAVLVIMAIIALIVTPLVMSIIKKARISADKRSVDAYGRSIELAIAGYLLDNGRFATEVSQLSIEYSGDKVECDIELINKDNTVYLNKCKVNNKLVDNYKYGFDKRTAVEVLLSKTNSIDITNYNDGNKGEMYTFEHGATAQTSSLTDYRYIGNVPNNYVSFNDGETWRIIGVFSVDDGNGNYDERIKLIKDDSLGNKPWNSSNVNEWVGSTMQVFLNDEYSLDDMSSEMIKPSKYYLGGWGGMSITNGEDLYTSERSETVYNTDRSTSWVGNIALMYPSDYAFIYALGVDNTCYKTPSSCHNSTPSSGWLFRPEYTQWILTPNPRYASFAFNLSSSGIIYNYGGGVVSTLAGANPVLYLNSNVRIKEGDGTIDDPYVFEL